MYNIINPPQEPREPVRPPMVYVTEPLRWEYKLVLRNLEDEKPLSEEELDTLGTDGWELTGILSAPSTAYYYFKRPVKS